MGNTHRYPFGIFFYREYLRFFWGALAVLFTASSIVIASAWFVGTSIDSWLYRILAFAAIIIAVFLLFRLLFIIQFAFEFLSNALHFEPYSPAIMDLEEKRDIKGLHSLLFNRLSDRHKDQAARVLGDIGGKESLQPLLKALDDGLASPTFRLGTSYLPQYAAETLGKLGDERAVSALLNVLDDEAEDLRKTAVIALGAIGHPQAIEPLRQTLLDDEIFPVRCHAAKALESLGHEPETDLVEVLQRKDQAKSLPAIWLLGTLGYTRSTEALVALLNDSAPSLRLAAAVALAQLGDERAIDPLQRILYDGIPNEQDDWDADADLYSGSERGTEMRMSLLARVSIGAPAVGSLVQNLDHRKSFVRATAAEALGQIGDNRSIEPLARLLEDENEWVRHAAAIALGKSGDTRANGILLQIAPGTGYGHDAQAAMALAASKDPQIIDPLVQALHSETISFGLDDFVHSAHSGLPDLKPEEILAGMGDIAVELLETKLKDGNRSVRHLAIKALGLIRSPSSVTPLIHLLKSRHLDTRLLAIGALGDIGTAPAMDAIKKMAGDRNRYIRRRVRHAIGA